MEFLKVSSTKHFWKHVQIWKRQVWDFKWFVTNNLNVGQVQMQNLSIYLYLYLILSSHYTNNNWRYSTSLVYNPSLPVEQTLLLCISLTHMCWDRICGRCHNPYLDMMSICLVLVFYYGFLFDVFQGNISCQNLNYTHCKPALLLHQQVQFSEAPVLLQTHFCFYFPVQKSTLPLDSKTFQTGQKFIWPLLWIYEPIKKHYKERNPLSILILCIRLSFWPSLAIYI